MGENGEFWRLAQDLMESESEATDDGLPISEPPVTRPLKVQPALWPPRNA